MAPKVLVSDKLSETAVQIFRDRGIDVTFAPDLGKDKIALLKAIPEFDGLAIRSATKVTEKILNNATNLKVVARAGIGVDNVDIPAATHFLLVEKPTEFNRAIAQFLHKVTAITE